MCYYSRSKNTNLIIITKTVWYPMAGPKALGISSTKNYAIEGDKY